MQLQEAVALISHTDFKLPGKQTWADLGCGSGLFTSALASLLQPESMIYAIDNDSAALKKISSFNKVTIQTKQLNFVTGDLEINDLDGILMANSLHYVNDKISFLNKAIRYMKPESIFIIVEYDTDMPVNRWVPYPINFQSLKKLFSEAGYASVSKLHERKSVYNSGNIYSALVTG